MGSARRVLAYLVAGCLTGCGAQGQQWVEAPSRSDAPLREEPGPGWELAEAPPPRPRLDRVLTLGQSHLPSPEPTHPPAAPDIAAPNTAPPTVVQIDNTFAPQMVGGWAPWMGWSGATCLQCAGGPRTPARVPAAAPRTQPGRDWPAVEDHGPAFPFSAAPGDPWSSRR